MKCYKEKELIIFDFEDGKRATYNLNTGETIGKCGKPVQSLCSALAGYNIMDVLNAFTDEKYRNFIKYVYEQLTPKVYLRYSYERQSKVKNLGTLFKYVNDYKILEQYWIAGIENVDKHIYTPISDVPKGLLKLCRAYDKQLTDSLIRSYKAIPNVYQVAFSMEFESLEHRALWNVLDCLVPRTYYGYGDNSHHLLERYNYNLKALLRYVDYAYRKNRWVGLKGGSDRHHISRLCC